MKKNFTNYLATALADIFIYTVVIVALLCMSKFLAKAFTWTFGIRVDSLVVFVITVVVVITRTVYYTYKRRNKDSGAESSI